MFRLRIINEIRKKLSNEEVSLGSWMQIPDSSIAEIMGTSGFDWVALDMEHGAISLAQLPDLFRALELGGTLPLVRLAQSSPKDCKQALDAGAGGVIVPMIETKEELIQAKKYCCWPPNGSRGVAFSRANNFGRFFEEYKQEAQNPILIALIETEKGLKNIDEIIEAEGLDAIMIGPYDLSASLGITAQFENQIFKDAITKITSSAKRKKIPFGIHIIEPSKKELDLRIKEGFKFIAYSIDSVMLRHAADSYKNRKI